MIKMLKHSSNGIGELSSHLRFVSTQMHHTVSCHTVADLLLTHTVAQPSPTKQNNPV
jgi:hypothetical protein